MAKYYDTVNAPIYALGQRFLTHCLQNDDSLITDDVPIWTVANLDKLDEKFVKNLDTGEGGFLDKLPGQIQDAGDNVCALFAELLAVYFLFPAGTGPIEKKTQINMVLNWAHRSLPVGGLLDQSIGGAGPAFAYNKPYEIAFLITFARAWKNAPESQRKTASEDPWQFMEFMDSIQDAESAQIRHVMLHLVFPDSFERIASRTDKRNVISIFSEFVTDPEADVDRQLFSIRTQLNESLESSDFDFYEAPLLSVWKDSGKSVEAGVALDALRFKRQVILYGPPGTGKTFSAKQLAQTILRSALVKALGAKEYFRREKSGELADEIKSRTHRVQFHPAYGYEDFIRGLHLDKHGATVYRLGRLPKIIDAMRADSLSIPHVLLLDEINRTDLSRTLGECFSLLEDRDQPVELPAHDDKGSVMTLTLPKQLYVIGTMNLIDQSVEQIDFALRRRFLWVRCGYDAKSLVSASQSIWESTPGKSITWDRVASDFQLLASATTALNRRIHDSEFLGEQYEIGHTYLLDAVSFLKDELGTRPKTFLWNKDGTAKQPVRKLWDLSLRPLLREYLAGLDAKTRDDELQALEVIFLKVPPT